MINNTEEEEENSIHHVEIKSMKFSDVKSINKLNKETI